MKRKRVSERRACRIVGLARSMHTYRPVPKDEAAVVSRMKKQASGNRRCDYLRLRAMQRHDGMVRILWRACRLYTEQCLKVRTRK